MMTSKSEVRISRFWENNFINWILHFRVAFTFDFRLSIYINTSDMSLGSFSSKFWVDNVTELCQSIKILRKRFHKRIIHLKVPFAFDFHFSINHHYMKYQYSPWWVYSSKFWDSSFKNFTSNFPSLLTFIFLSTLVHEIRI